MTAVPLPAKTASNAAVNLLSRSRMRNRKHPALSLEVHEQVAGELGDPCAGRVGGDAQDVNAPGGDLHDEEDVEAFEEDGVHVHEVAGQKRVGLGSEEGTPGLLGCALRCGR